MTINYTILGLLESGDRSGYDLKKVMQELDFLPWSGNNNQIYKALVFLLEEGLVENRTAHREDVYKRQPLTYCCLASASSSASWLSRSSPLIKEPSVRCCEHWSGERQGKITQNICRI